jgi:hypothetical protein
VDIAALLGWMANFVAVLSTDTLKQTHKNLDCMPPYNLTEPKGDEK